MRQSVFYQSLAAIIHASFCPKMQRRPMDSIFCTFARRVINNGSMTQNCQQRKPEMMVYYVNKDPYGMLTQCC